MWAESTENRGSKFYFTVKCGRGGSSGSSGDPEVLNTQAFSISRQAGLSIEERMMLICAPSPVRQHLLTQLPHVGVVSNEEAWLASAGSWNGETVGVVIINFTDLRDPSAVFAALHALSPPLPCVILALSWEYAHAKQFRGARDRIVSKPIRDLPKVARDHLRNPRAAVAPCHASPSVSGRSLQDDPTSVPAADPAPSLAPAPDASMYETHPNGIRIFIVDDQFMNRKILVSGCASARQENGEIAQHRGDS